MKRSAIPFPGAGAEAATVLRRPMLHDRRGSAAIEFAFVAPVFLLACFLVIEAGRYFLCLHQFEAALARVQRQLYLTPEMTASQVQDSVCRDVTVPPCAAMTVSMNRTTTAGQTFVELTVAAPFASPLQDLLSTPVSISVSGRVLLP
jgi:Flp pilus assembly protein TadG